MFFLEMEFRPVDLEDKPILKPFLDQYPQPISGFTFAMLFIWKHVYQYEWAFMDKDLLLLIMRSPQDGRYHLMQPIGNFSKPKQDAILEIASTENYDFQIHNVTQKFCQDYPSFVSHFVIQENRNEANYIYRTKDLAFLEGGRYKNKRNHISQLEKNHHWSLSPLTSRCGPDCIKILDEIAYPDLPLGTLEQERTALLNTMTHFSILEQKGFMIKIDSIPMAFSIFENISPSTIAVHFEKAKRIPKGLFQLINRETARYAWENGYEYINREEDMGDEGLRMAKMQYYPIELQPCFTLSFNKVKKVCNFNLPMLLTEKAEEKS